MCSVSECGRAVAARGWCSAHYQKLRERKPCSADGCDRPSRGAGLCTIHYNASRVTPPCTVEGCSTPSKGRGMCSTHYARVHRNGSLEYVIEPLDRSADTETHKACSKCGETLARALFWEDKRKYSSDGLRSACKACEYATARATRNVTRERERAQERRAIPEVVAARREWWSEYYDKNREAYSRRAHERRARLAAAHVDDGITVSALREIHGSACVFCGTEMLFSTDAARDPLLASIEHMTPLARGGLHSWENCRLSCLDCNVRKNAKTAAEFTEYRKSLGMSLA